LDTFSAFGGCDEVVVVAAAAGGAVSFSSLLLLWKSCSESSSSITCDEKLSNKPLAEFSPLLSRDARLRLAAVFKLLLLLLPAAAAAEEEVALDCCCCCCCLLVGGGDVLLFLSPFLLLLLWLLLWLLWLRDFSSANKLLAIVSSILMSSSRSRLGARLGPTLPRPAKLLPKSKLRGPREEELPPPNLGTCGGMMNGRVEWSGSSLVFFFCRFLD